MEKVEAWKDRRGELHSNRRSAAIADLKFELENVLGCLPSNTLDNAESLAFGLAHYPSARKALIEALLAYETDVK